MLTINTGILVFVLIAVTVSAFYLGRRSIVSDFQKACNMMTAAVTSATNQKTKALLRGIRRITFDKNGIDIKENIDLAIEENKGYKVSVTTGSEKEDDSE